MIILTGKNLGERQRELNAKVKEAVTTNVEFEEIKNETEMSDVDKLFKIDVASKYMNIDYIVEILKSGDSLYISRALKCSWIYEDDFANVINVDYLHNNVIPFMSTKMKKKLLTAISMHVRNKKRAADFYKYCMTIKYTSIALKFLNFTSDDFKLEFIKDRTNCNDLLSGAESEYLKHFIGHSFTLADAYITLFSKGYRLKVFRELSYLYTISNVKYLDLLEKSYITNRLSYIHLGLRISKDIMKKHKNRVLKNPSLYVNILSQSVLARYSKAEDAKIYVVAVLPDKAEIFWSENFCTTYKFILDLIPDGKFQFLKQVFTTQYPGEEFETTLNFYNMQYYTFMTAKEKETWSLNHIASGAEILGIGRDFNWYKFVSFDKALEEIKNLVMVTRDNTKRADMVNILVESAKNQRDIEILLKYFYERHINEQRYTKENFVDKLINYFNVYEFDNACWAALNKLFYNLEVYSMTNYFNCKSDYKIIVLIYNIINKKDVHDAIKMYIRSNMYFYILKLNTDKLPTEQQEMIFNYLFEFYMDEIRKSENIPYDEDVKNHLRKYIFFILDLLDQFNRTRKDCPELFDHFLKLDWAEFKCHRLLHEPAKKEGTQVDLMRDLKTDANGLSENLLQLKQKINSYYMYNISTVLKKLKIYFSHDIAKEYLKFFDKLLTEDDLVWYKVADAAVHAIFQLGDERFKADFMEKYAPTEPKIDHSKISDKLFRIQQAICSHACYSRPPVPLKHMLMYIKGDYVHFCLPMFHSYLANLPLPLCMEFIESILNTPVSIQKHGIRLAFECFNAESLNKLVLRVWKKTKNISLRMIIFKAIFNKISDAKGAQNLVFDTLKSITSSLQEDDDDEVFALLVPYKLPSHLQAEYIEVAWKVLNQLPLKTVNLNRIGNFLDFMNKSIHLMRQDAVREIVDEFIASVFKSEEDKTKKSYEAHRLIEGKWYLTAAFIMNVSDKDDLDMKLKLTAHILKECLEPREGGIHKDKYVLRQTCFSFISNLENLSYNQRADQLENVNIIMQFVLQTLQDTLPIEETYMEIWELRLGIVARNVMAVMKLEQETTNQLNDEPAIKKMAATFSENLGNLIKEFVEKDTYFGSFLDVIHNKISDKIQTVRSLFFSDIDYKDVAVAISVELIQFETKEVYLLVLHLISSGYNTKYAEDLKTIINKIIELDNKEIRCNLYRLVNSCDSVRKVLHA